MYVVSRVVVSLVSAYLFDLGRASRGPNVLYTPVMTRYGIT